MRTKENTAVPNQTLNLDSVVKTPKRRFSWPHSGQSVLIPHASNNSSEGQSHSPSTDQTALPESLDSDEMRTKENTAVPNQTLNLDSAVKTPKRRFSWPHSGQSVLIPHASNNSSEGQSHSPSTDQTALPESLDSGNSIGEVNRVSMDIKMMNINDPKASSQTNQFPCPYRGLLNLGATCYLNATLQVLFMTKAFRERVLEAPSDTNKKLVSALKEIFEELSTQDKGAESVSTCGIIKSLGIQKYEQQDAVEYFLDILEKVGHELAEVFSGTLRNIRICSENHKSYDDSPFKSLQIPVNTRDGPCKLEDGVNTFFESTTLVEDDQMYCEDCDEKSDTIWSCKIQKYPTILPLHLKRFVYDYRCGFVKNDCPMDIPLHLSLQEHEYSLYAVINHMGSRFGGHYTAVIQSFTDNKWYRFDDSRVTVTDESKLERSGEAYLLLYQKTSSDTPVEDMKEGPETKTAEPGEPVEADRAECDGAHNKPQLEEVCKRRQDPEPKQEPEAKKACFTSPATADYPLPPFSPENPIGVDFVVPFCRLCSVFSEVNHCRSLQHYENFKKYYLSEHQGRTSAQTTSRQSFASE